MPAVDLNADLGESFGPYTIGEDQALIAQITSANIACGGHGGDPVVIDRTIAAAKKAGVAVGAHPGFPDRAGFGRRMIEMSSAEIELEVAYQVAALIGMSRRRQLPVIHVKPHGALYNLAWRDEPAAGAIARAVASLAPSLLLVAPAGSALEAAGKARGLAVVREAFADRAYQGDGTLVPRGQPGAVIEDPDQVARRAVEIVVGGRAQALDGSWVACPADTLSLHSDTPGAASLAAAVCRALLAAGVELLPMGQLLGQGRPS